MQKDNFTSFLLSCTFCAMTPFLQHLRKSSNFFPSISNFIICKCFTFGNDRLGRKRSLALYSKKNHVTSLDMGFVAP